MQIIAIQCVRGIAEADIIYCQPWGRWLLRTMLLLPSWTGAQQQQRSLLFDPIEFGSDSPRSQEKVQKSYRPSEGTDFSGASGREGGLQQREKVSGTPCHLRSKRHKSRHEDEGPAPRAVSPVPHFCLFVT